MQELVTRGQANTLFIAVLILGIVAGVVAALVAKGKGGKPVVFALGVGGPPVLIGVLWWVYNAIADRMGLDTVANLVVQLVLFVGIGTGCGLLWSRLAHAPSAKTQEGIDGS